MDATAIGKKVSEQRKKKGLTQEELATLTQVTVRTIQRIESGESRPRSFTLKAIATALEMPFEAFQSDEAVPEPTPEPVPLVSPVMENEEASAHFLRLFCLSCFSYLVLPFVHFLIPARMLKTQGQLPAEVRTFAREVIREQVQWVICLHALMLLTVAYNFLQARYGNRLYLLSYLTIVFLMYLLNAGLIGRRLWQIRTCFGRQLTVSR